jgi:hypothetical protein
VGGVKRDGWFGKPDGNRHVLPAVQLASERGAHIHFASTVAKPEGLPVNLPAGELDH